MSLIDTSVFNGNLNVPQLGQGSVVKNLQRYIDRYEPRVLQAALGYQLYLDFTAGLKASVVDQKWLDLKNGVVFTSNGMWPPFFWQYPFIQTYMRNWYIPMNPVREMDWVGFVPKDGIFDSPIAGYVYYMYTRDDVTQNTGVGIVNSKSENAVSISPARKLIDAYNQMSKDIFSLWYFLEVQGITVYPSYDRLKINYNFFKPINAYNI